MIDSAISLLARVNHLEQSSPYGYVPGKAPGYAYVVVFGVGLLLHIGLAVRYKYWIAMVTLIPGGLLEILGWAGRLWSAEKPTNSNPFLMQICCLILGPAFFSAWAYTILGYCITRLGSAYSLLKPKWYLITFVSADIISLVLQAIGGGRAAVAAKLGTNTHTATQISLGLCISSQASQLSQTSQTSHTSSSSILPDFHSSLLTPLVTITTAPRAFRLVPLDSYPCEPDLLRHASSVAPSLHLPCPHPPSLADARPFPRPRGLADARPSPRGLANARPLVLAGILFQLVTMTVFVVLAVDFIARVILRKPYAFQLRRSAAASASVSASGSETHSPHESGIDAEVAKSNPTLHHASGGADSSESDPGALRRAEWLLAGVAFASLMIYVRGIYRAIELAQGWSGYLITHEPYFIYLDGLPMVLCYYAFAALHPGFLLPRRQGWGRA
ncbi:hypothetical protein EHS25_004045 [Saitozyma podzolica]|uniref:Uncharacterized protein n=1 Tax=Saitozyma podzolica TaxID=1890683 RepID=A0A427YT34_9TREE|nr:hypothetical protein EHS25_004045 [Saitozyma podzolica]